MDNRCISISIISNCNNTPNTLQMELRKVMTKVTKDHLNLNIEKTVREKHHQKDHSFI